MKRTVNSNGYNEQETLNDLQVETGIEKGRWDRNIRLNSQLGIYRINAKQIIDLSTYQDDDPQNGEPAPQALRGLPLKGDPIVRRKLVHDALHFPTI